MTRTMDPLRESQMVGLPTGRRDVEVKVRERNNYIYEPRERRNLFVLGRKWRPKAEDR